MKALSKLIFNVHLEFLKLRRQRVWLITLLAIPLLAYIGTNSGHSPQTYLAAFFSAPFYNAILMPILCAAISSRICENEFDGSTFKSLLTMQKPHELFHAKFITSALFIAVLCSVEPITIFITGHTLHYSDTFSLADLVYFAATQYLVCLLISIIIQALALYYENQLVPISVGVVLGLLGIFSAFLGQFMQFSPSAYFSFVNFARMYWNEKTGTTTFYHVGYPWHYVAGIAIAAVVIYIVSLKWFKNKEN